MRRIIFRGYTNKYLHWYYGSLDMGKDGKRFIKEINNNTVIRYRVDEESIGQWTGLEDCKGNPIYEGDWLEDGEGKRYLVCWDDALATFYLSGKDSWTRFTDKLKGTDFEIVGNYYEENLR